MVARSKAALDDNERALISKAIKGNAKAFGVLYERHMNAIYRYIYFRVGDAEQAEDMTEDVFLKAWEALPKYRTREHPFTSWLYRIAHNLVVDYYRRNKTVEEMLDSNLIVKEYPDPLPEEVVVERQNYKELVNAIKQLDDDEQEVIILRFVEGLSHKQVAQIIGKSEGASRVIQHRALAELTFKLNNGGGSHGGR